MPMIETTLSAGYQVNEWGVREALREIVSNAIDGQERGRSSGTGQMTMEYSSRKRVFTISNAMTKVPTKALLMGTSESRENDACIGTFGEGLPMALLVMARKGLDVTIYNGDEKWSPKIVNSKTFGAEVLGIETRQMFKDRAAFVVEIGDIDPEEYEGIRTMFLSLDPAFDESKDTLGSSWAPERVLLPERYRGMVYNKGVFVCRRDDLLFGYNLSQKLNRDRSIIDTYDLKYAIGDVLAKAVEAQPETFAKVLISGLLDNPNSLENQSQWSSLRYNSRFREALLEEWVMLYGAKTIAVASAEEVRQAELLGLKGVVAPPLLLELMKEALGSFVSMKETLGSTLVHRIDRSDMDAPQRAAFDRLWIKLGSLLVAEGRDLYVGRFGLESTLSTFTAESVNLAVGLLSQPVEAAKALTGEIAKIRAARNGSRAVDEQLTILATLAVA